MNSTQTNTVLMQSSLNLAVEANSLQPEQFQAQLINNISTALLRDNPPPCLLRAPTGSGKTFVMSQILQQVGREKQVLWFWFVPFVTLVNQTIDALVRHAPELSPKLFNQGRNEEVGAGTVLISTAQAVARGVWRRADYDADGDDEIRTLAELVALTRSKEIEIGLIVDEAHIGLDKSTEFGKFAQWLQPKYLLMATATPRDQRLAEFLAHAGYSAQESFAVSRDDVVKARLNKKYIEAVIYSLGTGMQQVTDLRRTVLRQAWARNQSIAQQLKQADISCVPLLLVQVANGENTVDEAAEELMRLCQVPAEAIGKHTADKPDPVMMAAIANDTSKQVLIFKQSAGTGFDAPRAFVLASTKPVNDTDFAMQFIGRVMRVPMQVREAFSKAAAIPASLNTAYVYLGNSEAQAGFEAAVRTTSEVRTELEGQTEKLIARKTAAGGLVYTNKPISNMPLDYAFGMPTPGDNDSLYDTPEAGAYHQYSQQPLAETEGSMQDLFAEQGFILDELQPEPTAKPVRDKAPETTQQVLDLLRENRLRTFPRKSGLVTLNNALKSEEKPSLLDLSDISRQVAEKLTISEQLATTAVNAALNRILQTERRTELTENKSQEEKIQVITDRTALAREAMQALTALPHAEEEDYRIIIHTLSSRLRPVVDAALADTPLDAPPTEQEMIRLSRDAANWVIRDSNQELRESIFQAIADQAKEIDAQPLPDVMIFPEDLPLEGSSKNIYGVLPPTTEQSQSVEQVLFMDERRWWADKTFTVQDSQVFSVGRYDGAIKLNTLEQAFARALDEAEFVHWWHRNPDKKPYSVRVVRAEHEHYFYPDFVVCLSHSDGEAPMQRLLETKESTKDAARKAQHFPPSYGKVLFITPDGDRLRWVNDDGSLGEVVKLTELQDIQEKLRSSLEEI